MNEKNTSSAEEMVTEPDPSEYGVTKYGEAQWKWDHADQSRALEFFIAQHYYERVTAARRIAELEQQLADAARNYFALNTTPEPRASLSTGCKDKNGREIFEGDRVNVTWLAELGITELDCEEEGTVTYMVDGVTPAYFVKFDRPYKRYVAEIADEPAFYDPEHVELFNVPDDEDSTWHFEVISSAPTKTTAEPRASLDDFDHRELLTKLDNISSYGVDDAYGIVAMAARAIKQFSSSSLPPKIQAIVDAAIAWSYCPAAGGYRDGPAAEDTVEHLDMAVHDYTDSEAESPEHPNHWTLGEMRAALTKEGSNGQ